ncbi:MAG: hypothetical protein GY861_16975 [bacterium]|nr:hypothetical protein [bacterium]
MMRKEEGDKDFKKQLQNPPRPQQTEPSPAFIQHLDDMQSGKLKSEETLQKEARAKQMNENDSKYSLFCPHCRRPTLKRRGPNMYSCGFCGLDTTAPLRMATSAEDQKESEPDKQAENDKDDSVDK